MKCWRYESEDNLIYKDRIIKLYLSTEPVTLGHCILTTAVHWPNIEDIAEGDYLKVQSSSQAGFSL